jgi:hypothetical protein
VVAVVVVLLMVAWTVVAVGAGPLRKHLAGKRADEARVNVQAIARAASRATERDRTPCLPAAPVPRDIPRGRSYTPRPTAGEDFQRGSAVEGWPCLDVRITSPIRHRYEVRVGGPYKSVPRGAPDPGPHGVEISAEGDADADGVESLFVLMGRFDPTHHRLVFPDAMFEIDPDE